MAKGDSFGAYGPISPSETLASTDLVGSGVPEEFQTRDFSGYPADVVMEYRLDTMVPSPQRAVWSSDSEAEMPGEESDY